MKISGYVYHDVTNRHWAKKGIDSGVDGLICVNNRAGGHLGPDSMLKMYNVSQNVQEENDKICQGQFSTIFALEGVFHLMCNYLL